MLDQIISRIEKTDKIENVALNFHIPGNATYVIVDVNFNYKIISKERFSFNSKYIVMDFYSQLINLNKAVDTKKTITSNNYLSFFCKNLDKLNDNTIDKYYEKLNINNEHLVYKEWIKKNIKKIADEAPSKQLIKIFFENPIENYIREGEKYFKKYILSNEIEINDNLYGNSLFLNLNNKKPFLKTLSRRENIPALINISEALKIKFLYNILYSLIRKGKDALYILENGELIPLSLSKCEMATKNFVNGIMLVYKIDNRGNLVILDMDTVPQYNINL